jgi:hypothetical protein
MVEHRGGSTHRPCGVGQYPIATRVGPATKMRMTGGPVASRERLETQ